MPAGGKPAQPPKQQPAAEQPKAPQDQRGTRASPLIVEIPATPESEQQAAEDAKDRHEKATWDKGLVYLTGALALFTFVLGVATWLLYRETAKAVQDSAKNLELTQQIHIADQRPWVGIESIKPHGNFSRDEMGLNIPLTFMLANFGRVPAQRVDIIAKCMCGGDFTEAVKKLEKLKAENRQPNSVFNTCIFPGAPRPWTIGVFVVESEIIEAPFDEEQIALNPIVYGCVRYESGLPGDAMVHQSSFVVRITRRASSITMPKGQKKLMVPVERLDIIDWPQGWAAD